MSVLQEPPLSPSMAYGACATEGPPNVVTSTGDATNCCRIATHPALTAVAPKAAGALGSKKVVGMLCTHSDQFNWRTIDGLTIDVTVIRHRRTKTPQTIIEAGRGMDRSA